MSLNEPDFIVFIKKVFADHGCDYVEILGKFYDVSNTSPSDWSRLAVYSHFYYFICAPDKNDVREELQIVGITSLIEAMMQKVEYKDILSYLEESEFLDNNNINISNYKTFKENYLERHGANKKIIKYFKEYISQDDANTVLKNIKKWSKEIGDFKQLNNLEQLAKFLYQMRSDFVHKAEMRNFRPNNVNMAFISVGNSHYSVNVNISEILRIFEKSFVNYWKEKYEAL